MIVRIGAKVAWRNVDGVTFALKLDVRVLYGLDDAGGEVWTELANEPSWESLRTRFTQDLGAAEAQVVSRRLLRFVRDLAGLGLVTLEGDPAEPGIAQEGIDVPFNPTILWQEKLEAVAASCAHFPGQNPICIQAPKG